MAIANSVNNSILTSYRNSASPVWISATQFSMNYLLERANTGSCNIYSSSPITVTTTNVGANGFLVSPTLTGTISVTSGSATVTGVGTSFTSTTLGFSVGDIISTGTQSRRITVITSNTSMTVSSNFTATQSAVTYKRGGTCNQSPYYLYAIAYANGTNPALALSTRSLSLGQVFPTADLPTSYTIYREMPFSIYLDSSGNLTKFIICEGWPYRPVILYDVGQSTLDTSMLLYNGATTTTMLTVNCYPFVPYTSSIALVNCLNTGPNGRGTLTLPLYATGEYDLNDNNDKVAVQARAFLNSANALQYLESQSGNSKEFWLVGHIITNVV